MKKIFLLLFFILIDIFFVGKGCLYDDFFFAEKEYRLQSQEKRNNFKKGTDEFFDSIFEKGFAFLACLVVVIIIYDCYRLRNASNNIKEA